MLGSGCVSDIGLDGIGGILQTSAANYFKFGDLIDNVLLGTFDVIDDNSLKSSGDQFFTDFFFNADFKDLHNKYLFLFTELSEVHYKPSGSTSRQRMVRGHQPT